MAQSSPPPPPPDIIPVAPLPRPHHYSHCFCFVSALLYATPTTALNKPTAQNTRHRYLAPVFVADFRSPIPNLVPGGPGPREMNLERVTVTPAGYPSQYDSGSSIHFEQTFVLQ
ncbi:uncharacterized protein LAESUDRAFT_764677 [Laetiporus sulphureus 93-53]|uniref:Uncharacterized protein n=1 Tax=Laetiporus sulphureus 93-53 TaxID=1314785 RepID=A0A165B749_9APHY|nr:uncharacterized protein LAESUDRAFT_764677 [Laetiporus sulphureus 93-53]KZT00399.1 hypothetical protein LAESUDRAFT_764677 [Laetiporus sulphureus 93-53]